MLSESFELKNVSIKQVSKKFSSPKQIVKKFMIDFHFIFLQQKNREKIRNLVYQLKFVLSLIHFTYTKKKITNIQWTYSSQYVVKLSFLPVVLLLQCRHYLSRSVGGFACFQFVFVCFFLFLFNFVCYYLIKKITSEVT